MKFLRFWGPPILWMGIIFLLSQKQRISVSETHVINFLFFKTLHVIEYGALFLMLYRAFRNMTRLSKYDAAKSAFILTIAYGAFDEFHQTLVPTREGTLRDVIIDGLGVTLAWIFLFRLLQKMPKRLKTWASDWQLI